MNNSSLIRWGIVLLSLMLLAGCGKNSSSSPSLSGIAAAGAPLVGTVSLKDSSAPAKELSTQLAADGSFSFDLNGLTPPYLLKASGTANQTLRTLYSFSPSGGIANINPLSSLALALANNNNELKSLYDAPDPVTLLAIRDAMENAVSSIQTALRPTLERFGVGGVNFITAPYIANHYGLDLLLDLSYISTAHGVVTLDDRTGSPMNWPLGVFIGNSYDFITNPVTTPGVVCILPGSSSLQTGESGYFNAFVVGSKKETVSWSVVESDGGSITAEGLYTAPGTPGRYHVRATSSADPARSSTALVIVRSRENIFSVVKTGPGEYTVMGENLVNLSGAEIEITFDTSTLANPRITQGELTGQALFISNSKFKPDGVKLAFMSLFPPISGNGSLATIKFDVVGAAPGAVSITKGLANATNGIAYNYGDIDGDGIVRLADALAALRFVAGITVPTPAQITACNVNSDSISLPPADSGLTQPNCDIKDAVLIMRQAFGLTDVME